MFSPDEPSYVRAEIQKRSRDSEQRRVVMAALDLGAPAKLTRSGVVFAGPEGETAGTHWTNSDYRALMNFESQLRRIGIPITRPTPKRSGPRKFKPASSPQRPGHHHIPAPYEPPRQETTSYTLYVPGEPEPELEQPRRSRDVGARARNLGARTERPEYAIAYPRMSDELRAYENHDLVVRALALADGDPRCITVEPDGALMVWNQPRK